MPPSPPRRVAIIGAGPAGLTAAGHIAAAGHDVMLIERMPSPARKLLMAGRGGLNLTHSEALSQFIARYGASAEWIRGPLQAFPPAALRAWADGLGQATFTGSSGRVFPKSMKSSPLLRAWLGELQRLNVKLLLGHDWIGWSERKTPAAGPPPGLRLKRRDGVTVIAQPDAVVLALGGASWPRLGADGSWVPLLAGRGIEITPLSASNCGALIRWTPVFADRFAGVPLKRIALKIGETASSGEAMITETGLEGGAVYALGSAIRGALAAGDGVDATIVIDLRPDLPLPRISERLDAQRGKPSMSTLLRKAAGLSPAAIGLMREAAGKVLPTEAVTLATLVKSCPLRITGTAGLARAISTAGGIARHEVDDNFMLTHLPGVFAAGEMLDWDAPTGGYLLQGTMATAVAAAAGVNRWLRA